MASSYEDRMAQKYKFLKKDSAEILSKEQEKESVAEEDSNSETTNNLSTTEESLLVPLDAWNTVLNQLGNLHEANQMMAEARERAAKAEAESEFLREKLKTIRQQLEEVSKKKRFFFF
jgi:hypothetical protein